MANVLGTLFSDIANAIRNKTGSTEKLSPAEFPIAIDNIVVNIGGENSNTEWKFASGTATSTGDTLTITHGLGAVPDIIYVVPTNRLSGETTYYMGGIGFSDAMTKAIGGNGDERGIQYAYGNVLGVLPLALEEGVEGAHSTWSDMYGHIRNANTVTFQVGGGATCPISSGVKIEWWAVSGIT